MNYKIRKVHIVTASKLNDLQEEESKISFGLSGPSIDNEKFFFSKIPYTLLKGKPYPIVNEDSITFLVIYRNNLKKNGFYKGSAFQNGKITKEFTIIKGDMCQHHYYIEYIGKSFDSVSVKPYFEK